MRYVGQEHAVTVELPTELFQDQDRAGIKALFDAVASDPATVFSVAHEKGRESSACAAAIIGQLRKAARSSTSPRAMPSPDAEAFRGKRPVYFRQHRLRRHGPTYTTDRR